VLTAHYFGYKLTHTHHRLDLRVHLAQLEEVDEVVTFIVLVGHREILENDTCANDEV
jgi:hypothetical protein